MLSSHLISFWHACHLGTICIAITLAMAPATKAQNVIIPDATLGANESSIVVPLNNGEFDLITGGAIREQNLFHSFEEFSIGEDNAAFFVTNSDAIANILARVTGNNISEIQGFLGTIQLSNGNASSTDANLFLLNPNGIVFGENALLGIDGSFYATTAEAIELGDQIFSATTPAPSSLLAVNPSTVFTNYLTENSGNIENRGVLIVPASLTLAANQLMLQDSLIAAEKHLTLQAINDTSIIDSRVRLLDSAGDLLIQGRDIAIANSILDVTGSSNLDNDLTLEATNDISILNSDVSLFDSTGDLLVQSGDILITDSILSTVGQGELGNIILVANDRVDILASENSAELLSFVEGPGTRASDISIIAANLSVIDKSNQNISAAAIGTFANDGGNSGNITLDINNAILLDGILLTSFLGGDTAGNAGSIQMMATDIEMLNGTQIQADVSFRSESLNAGNTGNITINASGNLRLNGFRQINGVSLPNFITTSVSNQGSGNAGSILISANMIEIDDLATLSTSTNGSGSAGNVEINANQLEFRNGASVSSTSSGQGSAGDIVLDITNTASFDGTAIVDQALTDALPNDVPDFVRDAFADVDPNAPVGTGLFARAFGSGSGGNIQLRANNLTITNGATLSASTNGSGNAGNITLDIANTAWVDGRSDDGLSPSFIDADTSQGSTGNGGELRITATQLNVTGGAQLVSSLSGTGTAGDIFVEAETVLIQGPDANSAASGTESPRSGIISNIQETGQGIAGDIVITAHNLILANGGVIDASVLGNGDGGDIILRIADTARIAGVTPTGLPSLVGNGNDAIEVGSAGDIFLSAGSLEIIDGGRILNSTLQTGGAGVVTLDIAGTMRLAGVNPVIPERSSGVFSRTESSSSGGSLRIFAEDIELLNGATLNTTSLAEGPSGNIVIDLRGQLTANNGEITTASSETSGGTIDISAQAIRLRGNSDILTDVELGTGRGGDIILRADTILLFDDSDILAFSADGEGGNILLETPVFFGQNFQTSAQLITRQALEALDGNNRVDINATGRISSGNIEAPDLSNIARSLNELPSTLVNTENLIAGSCVTRGNDTSSSLVISGDGLAQQPHDYKISPYSTGTIQSLVDNASGPLVEEPEGVYLLPNGRLVLGRGIACDN